MSANQGRNTLTSADERLVMYERRRMRVETIVTLIGLVVFGYFAMNYLEARDAAQNQMRQIQQFQIDGARCPGQ